jgi:hypothetical protein
MATYWMEQQLEDAISFLESGRAHKARRLLEVTLDVMSGKKPVLDENCDPAWLTLRPENLARDPRRQNRNSG